MNNSTSTNNSTSIKYVLTNRTCQSAICCIYCGKNYKSRNGLEKHILLCEIIHKSRKKQNNQIIEDEEELPSQKIMYKMLLEIGQKYVKLEEKITEISKFVVKKKKHMNILEWLNTNVHPTFVFEQLTEKIKVTQEDIENLFSNSFNDTLNEIFSKTIYSMFEEYLPLPLYACVQKPNILYIYDKIENLDTNNTNNQCSWIELPRLKLTRFLNNLEFKITKALNEWRKINKDIIYSSDKMATLYDKTVLKIVSQDFKQEATLNKIKNMMYNKMKTDMIIHL